MLKPGKPDNEKERLRDLYSYDILDSPSEESFNRITRLARKYLNIPISLISLIDENRQWFKSKDGLSVSQTERDISFCAHAILEDSTFVVKDASKDERFYDNPLVSSGVKIRFYAGTQLKTPEGYNIGTLCVIDYKSRNLTFDEKSVLEDLGKIVINELELRKKYIAEKKTSVDILRRKIFYKSILDSTNDSIVVMNENGIIQEVNESTKKIFMYSREELIGQNVNILMPEPYKSEHDGYISDYLNTGFKKVIGKFRELKAIKKNGEVFPCELSVNEVKIEEESFFTGVLRDLTELNLSRKKQERQLEGMKVLNQIASVQDLGFEQLLQIVSDYLKLPIGMISNIENSLYTIEYCISFIPSFAPERKSYSLEDTYCNFCIKERNVFAIENIHNSEYISFPCYEIFRFESYIGIPIFLNEAIIGTVSFASIKPFSRKFDEADEEFFRMLSKLLSSIMIQHNMNEKLRRSEERLKRGQNFANIGTWDWNIQTGELYWTEKIAPLFGYPEGELETSYENFLRALHPEDREKVVKAIDACIYSDVDYYIEHRVLWPNGKIRWLLEKGDVLRNEEGEPVQMLGVVQDITHIKEAEQALLKSKEEANQANRAKSEFLSSMSHELRTPLNAILGFSQLLELNTREPLREKQKTYVSQILNGGNYLLALINDVLDLTKIEAGRISLSMEPIELKKVIEDCLALAHTLATKRSVRIHTHLETPSSLFVMADFTRIKQVLLNLLSNAVKYNHKEGSVIIKTKILDDEYVRIQVDDSGFGIPEEKHKDLFQSFSRLGQEKSQIEGTGIGLVITKKIIEAMNGRMGFSSEGGKGSSFWFELKYTIKIKDSPEASLPYDKSISIGVEKKRLIIYIEDNPANIVLMEEVIGNYPGLQLMSIHNAELGIELIIKEKPDLVIMDINLPGMSGIEAIEKIKMNPDIKDIPVIALSANVTFSDSRKGKELGFMEYIAKPIKVNELLFTLQKVLNI